MVQTEIGQESVNNSCLVVFYLLTVWQDYGWPSQCPVTMIRTTMIRT